jgi:hypothetical protein
MKRGGFLKRRTLLKAKGSSPTAIVKDNIQALLRAIVTARDGGCILRHLAGRYRDFPQCNGFNKANELILQADHLITRANSATYADYRLVVCVCQGHHAWKSKGGNARKAEYDALVKTLIEPERVGLWEACEKDSWRPHRTTAYDWLKEQAFLKVKLAAMQREQPTAGISYGS